MPNASFEEYFRYFVHLGLKTATEGSECVRLSILLPLFQVLLKFLQDGVNNGRGYNSLVNQNNYKHLQEIPD